MSSELTFNGLFHKQISKEILTHYFQIIWDNWHIDCRAKTKSEDLFLQIEKTTKFKPNKIFRLIGLLQIIDSIGVLGLRNLLQNRSERTWQRLKSEIMSLDKDGINNSNIFHSIIDGLNKFESIKIAQIQ